MSFFLLRRRCSFIPNREKLKTFIRSYANRLGNRADSPWIFYDPAIIEKYELKSRISDEEVAKFVKSSTITMNEILREQDRLASKQLEINNNTSIPPEHSDNMMIVLTDESHLIRNEPKKPKSKKQLTLDDMKFTKNSSNHKELIEKSTANTADVVLPNSLLQKLDRTRRERGIDSKFFQRLILQCARTLTDKQRLRLPDDYRSLIQIKFDELEFKRRLSTMTDEEKKRFLQSKREEQKPIEDLDLTLSKDLPIPKQISTTLFSNSQSIGNLLMICTFCTSCQSLFSLALDDQLTKTTQMHLRSFQFDVLLNSSTQIFTNYFLEILQIFMKLLFKEDENRSNTDDEDDESKSENEQSEIDPNENEKSNSSNEPPMFEEIYSIQLSDIPLTPYTCQELTRLYLLKEHDETNQSILNKLAICEAKDLNTTDQLDLLLLLINTITTDNELMSDYFEYLTRTLSEAARERAERRKAYEEDNKEKKLQLQNGEKEKISTKKTTNLIPNMSNDENQQMIVDENDEFDDDLKTVLQRRRQMVAMSKELKEKKELEAHKLQLKQKRQIALQKAEQIYQEALVNYQCGFRIKPLGYDRHYNRYWFFRGYPGLFVEKGWFGSNINYSFESTSNSFSTQEKLIPNDESNQWLFYDDENLIQQVYQSLNERGIREHNLAVNLKKILPFIHQEFENIKKIKAQTMDVDEQQEQNDIIQSFKNELEDIETRLRLGSLGGFGQNEWLNQLKQANQRSELTELLIQLQQTVADKYLSENFNDKCQQIWMNDCRTCETYSRLHVLMIIFDNSVTWNKSTQGMKCKICRKKSKDDNLLVCDQCCFGFHQECLRDSKDSARKSSNNLWYCLSCRPKTKTKAKSKPIPKLLNQNCTICGDENDLIHCTQCQRYYHCQCHEPPLRCPPRSTTWTCNPCRNQRSKRKNCKENQSSNEEEEEEDDDECDDDNDLDDEENDSRTKRRSKRLRKSEPSPVKALENRRRKTRSMKSISSDDDQTSMNNSELENDSNDSPSSTD